VKKICLVCFTLLLPLVLCATAGAMPYTLTDITYFTADGTNAEEDYVDHGWGDVNRLDGMADYVVWEHQYAFDPPLGTITSASLEIYLEDDEKDTFFPWTYELGLIVDESGNWGINEIDTDTYGYSLNGSFLADGSFRVGIASVWGDFLISSSKLTIDYNAAPVPEPASLFLMGTGLIGLTALGRKKFLR
jgi:hypothetical protein